MVIVDAQVVSEQTDLDSAHRRKKRYYAENHQVAQHARQQADTTNEIVIVTSATINWRSVWSKQSSTDLLATGITKRDLAIISSRVLVGGLAEFNCFNRGNGVARVGVG